MVLVISTTFNIFYVQCFSFLLYLFFSLFSLSFLVDKFVLDWFPLWSLYPGMVLAFPFFILFLLSPLRLYTCSKGLGFNGNSFRVLEVFSRKATLFLYSRNNIGVEVDSQFLQKQINLVWWRFMRKQKQISWPLIGLQICFVQYNSVNFLVSVSYWLLIILITSISATLDCLTYTSFREIIHSWSWKNPNTCY